MRNLPKIHLGVLLVITLLGKAQQVAPIDTLKCGEQQYLHDTLEKCCARCPPGTFMKKECTEISETECRQCEDGKYTSSWHYKTRCNLCRPCPAHLVMKEKCSRTMKEQCVCPDGYNCTQENGLGVCEVCKPIPKSTTAPLSPAEPNFVEVTSGKMSGEISDYPSWLIIIVLVIVAVILTLIALVIRHMRRNQAILEKFGCMSRVKKPQPESAVLELCTPPATTQHLLSSPIQESDATQSAEYAPNSRPLHPI